jgi:hypothetical protein
MRVTHFSLIGGAFLLAALQVAGAQDSSGDKSWTTTSQQGEPDGSVNPTRTRVTHTEVDGRIVDKTSVETLGPDGRYIPYSETERESVRVNDTTIRTVERTFGSNPDGEKMLVQEKQEETRKLADGGEKIVRTTSSPDANGGLQVVRREQVDSKQVSPDERDTKTTVLSADGSGGLATTVQIEEREKQSDAATVEFKKSTMLSDGSGHWTLSEVREGTTKKDGAQGSTKEERVMRPDVNGEFAVVERTVTKEADAGNGDRRNTVETYSTNVPGEAGDDRLQLVQRESTVRRTNANGGQSTTKQVERTNPGSPSDGLRVTQQAIDIVRSGSNGVAEEKSTILNADPDGRLGEVSIDIGKSDKPAAVTVDTGTATKPK